MKISSDFMPRRARRLDRAHKLVQLREDKLFLHDQVGIELFMRRKASEPTYMQDFRSWSEANEHMEEVVRPKLEKQKAELSLRRQVTQEKYITPPEDGYVRFEINA